MKKYIIVCAAFCAALTFTSCGASKESAYRKAYEKAKAQEQAQQQGQQPYQQAYGQQQYVQQDPAQYQQPAQQQYQRPAQQQYQQPAQQQYQQPAQQQYQQPAQQQYQQPAQQQYQQPVQQQAPAVTQLSQAPAQSAPVNNTTVRQASPAASAASNGLKAYSVVVGSFGLRANADGLQNTLKNAGYSNAQVIYDGKMYRVIASTYDVKESATKDKDALVAKYPGAWVMAK